MQVQWEQISDGLFAMGYTSHLEILLLTKFIKHFICASPLLISWKIIFAFCLQLRKCLLWTMWYCHVNLGLNHILCNVYVGLFICVYELNGEKRYEVNWYFITSKWSFLWGLQHNLDSVGVILFFSLQYHWALSHLAMREQSFIYEGSIQPDKTWKNKVYICIFSLY